MTVECPYCGQIGEAREIIAHVESDHADHPSVLVDRAGEARLEGLEKLGDAAVSWVRAPSPTTMAALRRGAREFEGLDLAYQEADAAYEAHRATKKASAP